MTFPSNDFPMAIDSTMRATFVACPQKYFREYFQHWKPKRESVDLVAGKAFAAGIEETRREFWERGNTNHELCIAAGAKALMKEWGNFEPPEGHVKQLDRMIGALEEYFMCYGFATDHIQPHEHGGKRTIEFSFAIPIPGTAHPTTGEPILYTGRFDMIGTYAGSIFVVDEKTTKQLGPTWNKNWVMRSQITGYCWAAKQFGVPVAGAIIRGISILKTKYGHAEVIQYRPDWVIDRWLDQLRRDINRMIECWKTDTWDYDLDTACTNYGGCLFLDICSSNIPERLLEAEFTKRVWDPLKREEISYDKA